jgi:ADP-heptose:LPS heptosyltransferase
MRLQSKRSLDYHVGRPVLSALQIAARVLGSVLRRSHAVEPIRSILIVKFQGLGSLVLCKPALAELRRRRPDARILFWGTSQMQPLAEQMPEFDEVLVLDDKTLMRALRSAAATLLRLWRVRVDWAVDLEVYSRLASVLVTLTCARNRTGFALEMLRSRRVHTHLVYFNRHKYLGEAYARIIGQLLPPRSAIGSVGDNYGSWRFELSPLPEIRSPYFVLNIHAGDLALERRWPRESFQVLIDELLRRRLDATAVLIGHGDAEVAYAAGLRRRDRLIDLSGRLSLPETFRLIANAELVVTNDSAPLHFALSTNVKVVALFGPTTADTYLPPARKNTAAAYVPLYCSPCVHHWEPPPCDGDNQCMKRVTVSHVLKLCCDLTGMTSEPLLVPEPCADDGRSTYYPGLVYKKSW